MQRTFIQLNPGMERPKPGVYGQPQLYVPKGNPLPDKVDLSHLFGPVENQLTLGACTAFAATQWYSAWQVALGKTWVEYDELAQYWEERNLEGTVNTDSGAFIHDAVKVLEDDGVMSEQGYNPANFTKQPDASKFIPGTTIPSSYVKQIDPMDLLPGVLDALANGYPVLFGMVVFPEIQSEEVAKTGIYGIPKPNEQSIGGHAMVAWGYDRTNPSLRTVDGRNQWGADWGDKGNIHIQWENFAQYAWECYVIEDPNLAPKPDPTPQPQPEPTPVHVPKVKMQINNPVIQVNGNPVTLDQAPIIVNNRAMIPLRGVFEGLGYTVNYDESNGEIDIN